MALTIPMTIMQTMMSVESPDSMPRTIRNPTPCLATTISAANTHIQPLLKAVYGEFCLPWYWMGYTPFDVKLPDNARTAPPVSEGCR